MLLTRVTYLRGSAIPRMRITKTSMLQAKAIRSRTISASPLRVTSHPLEPTHGQHSSSGQTNGQASGRGSVLID